MVEETVALFAGEIHETLGAVVSNGPVITPTPGAGRLAAALSRTSTQSLVSGEVKFCDPVVL
jgi:hypothetical protein